MSMLHASGYSIFLPLLIVPAAKTSFFIIMYSSNNKKKREVRDHFPVTDIKGANQGAGFVAGTKNKKGSLAVSVDFNDNTGKHGMRKAFIHWQTWPCALARPTAAAASTH
jgi:hypothetical protein